MTPEEAPRSCSYQEKRGGGGGGGTKSSISEGPQGPTTRSSARRATSATATAPAVSTAPAVTTLSAVTSTPPFRRTPTKAALKSYDAALARPASPVRDPLNPDLEADPLGGDP